MMRPGDVVSRLTDEARRLGFTQLGVAPPEAPHHMPYYRDWLAAGHHGEMAYLARAESVERRGDLAKTLPGVRSVIMVTHEYNQEDPPGVPDDPARGVIARYARGDDYHEVVKRKLEALGQWLADGVGELEARAYVDTGPILERDLARRAGLGWFGRNTMLIHPERGSYFFIGVLLVDVELPPSEPFEADRCGTCTACLDACPTGALLGRDENGAPVMDARRCISYLTIELRGSIPLHLRPLMGNRIYGCDDCQLVCPWNRFSEPTPETDFLPRHGLDAPRLVSLIEWDEATFRRQTEGSPIRRIGYECWLRNVAVALGNAETTAEVVNALRRRLEDASALVQEHVSWALERHASGNSKDRGPGAS